MAGGQLKITDMLSEKVPRTVRNIYGWLDLIVSDLEPFSFTESKTKRRYLEPTIGTVHVQTMKKYMHKLLV